MSRRSRMGWWSLVVLLAAAAFAGWSVFYVDQSRTQQQTAVGQLKTVQDYAQTIQTFRVQPNRVADREMQLTLLARLVEYAADEAGIDRQALDRIWPQPARRIRDTPYLRKSTQLVIRGVTLPQAVTFLHQLTHAGDQSLSLDSLRLSAARGSEWSSQTPETWTVEATVSELLYQPLATDTQVAQQN